MAYRGRRFQPQRSLSRRIADDALTIIILFGLLLLVAWLNDSGGNRAGPQGAVIVNDGDSLTVNHIRVRLWGIDAPEYVQSCTLANKPYNCGKSARSALAALIGKSSVICSNEGEDKYGRVLGICRAGDVELNAELVSSGWAVSYGGYKREEAAARAAKRGLWAGLFDAPRDFRRDHGTAVEQSHEPIAGPVADPLADIGDKLRGWISSFIARILG